MKKFKNLDREEDNLKSGIDGLSDFVTKTDRKREPAFNPLVEKRKPIVKEKPKEENKENVESASKEIPKKKVVEKEVTAAVNISLPDDFKSHSALFSEGQLNKLRRVVNYLKWKENPKFTIQAAIYEAIEMLINNRVPISNFPDDFITYSPSFSIDQRERLDSFIGKIRFQSNPKYALKYAIFEAIQIFLNAHPINE